MQTQEIQNLILKELPGSNVNVTSNDNIHFQATVIYHGFAGKNTLAQHRMVYKALQEALKDQIHALQLTTKTPEQEKA